MCYFLKFIVFYFYKNTLKQNKKNQYIFLFNFFSILIFIVENILRTIYWLNKKKYNFK